MLSSSYDSYMAHQTTLLFVYGTLKRGDVRAPLLDGQTYLGEAQTRPAYRLFNVGSYPALVEAAPLGILGRAIQGELWHVDDACLAWLDDEEGVDEGLYKRRPIELADDHADVNAMSYLYRRSVDGLADCGDSWPTAY